MHIVVDDFLDERLVEDRGLVLSHIVVDGLVENILTEDYCVVLLYILLQDIDESPVVENDFLMLINVVVDDLFHQFHIDEVGVVGNIIVDNLGNEHIVEDFNLVLLDISRDYLKQHLIVDKDILVIPDEVDEDIGDDIYINILCRIFKIVLVEKIHQHVVVEYLSVVQVEIVGNDLVEYLYVEYLSIVFLNVGGHYLEEHLLADECGGVLAYVVVDDLQKHLVVDDNGSKDIDILEGHAIVDGDGPLVDNGVVSHNRCRTGGRYGESVGIDYQHAVYRPVVYAADNSHADIRSRSKTVARTVLQNDNAAVRQCQFVAFGYCLHLSNIESVLRRCCEHGQLRELCVNRIHLALECSHAPVDVCVLVVQIVDIALEIFSARGNNHYCCS